LYFDPAENTGCELLVSPFPCCILPNFITNGSGGFLEKLKSELLRMKFHEKNNDLYQFHQVSEMRRCVYCNQSWCTFTWLKTNLTASFQLVAVISMLSHSIATVSRPAVPLERNNPSAW